VFNGAVAQSAYVYGYDWQFQCGEASPKLSQEQSGNSCIGK
jgi:hypothetical protein